MQSHAKLVMLIFLAFLFIVASCDPIPKELKQKRVQLKSEREVLYDGLDSWLQSLETKEKLLQDFVEYRKKYKAYMDKWNKYAYSSKSKQEVYASLNEEIETLRSDIEKLRELERERQERANNVYCVACHKEITSNRAFVMSGKNCYPISDLEGYHDSGRIIICSRQCCSDAKLTQEIFGL